MLGQNCPSLEELGAKIEGDWCGKSGPMLPKLKTCRVRIGLTATLKSLLVYAKNLTNLEVNFGFALTVQFPLTFTVCV